MEGADRTKYSYNLKTAKDRPGKIWEHVEQIRIQIYGYHRQYQEITDPTSVYVMFQKHNIKHRKIDFIPYIIMISTHPPPNQTYSNQNVLQFLYPPHG